MHTHIYRILLLSISFFLIVAPCYGTMDNREKKETKKTTLSIPERTKPGMSKEEIKTLWGKPARESFILLQDNTLIDQYVYTDLNYSISIACYFLTFQDGLLIAMTFCGEKQLQTNNLNLFSKYYNCPYLVIQKETRSSASE